MPGRGSLFVTAAGFVSFFGRAMHGPAHRKFLFQKLLWRKARWRGWSAGGRLPELRRFTASPDRKPHPEMRRVASILRPAC